MKLRSSILLSSSSFPLLSKEVLSRLYPAIFEVKWNEDLLNEVYFAGRTLGPRLPPHRGTQNSGCHLK